MFLKMSYSVDLIYIYIYIYMGVLDACLVISVMVI